MIFEALSEAADRGELLFQVGGMLHFHRRKDNVVTIREILVLPAWRGHRVGYTLLRDMVARCRNARALVARCPADLPSNGFWEHLGFRLLETIPGKRPVNVWRLDLSSSTALTATPPSPR